MQTIGIITSVIAVLLVGAAHIFHDSMNSYLMGFFRDLARIKARKRRMRNTMAVSTSSANDRLTKEDLKMLFFRQEDRDPLDDIQIQIDVDDNGEVKVHRLDSNNGDGLSSPYSDLVEYTREELFELGNGENEEGVILLSLYGRIYDVSAGHKHYGVGSKYHRFAGRDVTKALSTGCMAESCLGPKDSLSLKDEDDYFEMSPKVINEGKKWIAFFETHDKYSLVGVLKDGLSIDKLIDEQLEVEKDRDAGVRDRHEEYTKVEEDVIENK